MKNIAMGLSGLVLLVVSALALSGCGGSSPSPAATAISATSTLAEVKPTSTTGPTLSAEGEWKTFTTQEGGFSVLMPGTPTEASQTSDTASGKLTVHAFSSDQTKNPQYSATYLDYPTSANGADVNTMLAAALKGVVGSKTLVSQKTGTVQGIPSIEGEYEEPGSTYVWYKAVIYQDRLFQLFVSTPSADKETSRESAAKFFDSFQLLDTQSGTASVATQVQASDTSVPGQAADGWQTFTSDDGGFSVIMPAAPRPTVQTVKSDVGDLPQHMFLASSKDYSFAASYIDYPEGGVSDTSPDALLSSVMTGAEPDPNLTKESITVDGYPGLRIERNAPSQDAHVWHMVVAVKDRVYQLIVVARLEEKDKYAASAKRFQDSFKLLKP